MKFTVGKIGDWLTGLTKIYDCDGNFTAQSSINLPNVAAHADPT